MERWTIKGKLIRCMMLFLLISAKAVVCWAQTADSVSVSPSFAEESFQRGRFEATIASGALFSFGMPKSRPTINYTLTEVLGGYMLSDVKGPSLLRGNFEIAASGFGGDVFKGPGNYVAGMTFWARYNFVPEGSHLIPYVEGGAGLVSTGIDRRIVGQPFNFNLDVGVGVRYLPAQHWSVSLEYRFQHISNAHLAPVNIGVDAQGPILGVSYFF